MKTRFFAALALLATAPAFAQTVTLDFEGTAGYVHGIEQFYGGGTDALGQSGPNYGVSFSGAAVAFSNDDLGPYYADAPSPLTVMYAENASAFLNVASGFADRLTFAYSSLTNGLDVVTIHSGLNGTGTLLASASVFGNAGVGCSGPAFCNFDLTSVRFAGVGRSIGFGGNAGEVLYDNVTLALVPEPSAYLLMALGLAAVGVVKRRRAA